MLQPILPLELHERIIDVVGNEAVIAFQAAEMVDDKVLLALQSFSLVCRAWHASTLRHTFYGVRIAVSDGDSQDAEGLERTQLLHLLEVNPLIRQCIQDFDLYLTGPVSAEVVESLCHAVGPVETLRINMLKSSGVELSRSSPWDGLHHLLTTHHLRNLSIRSDYLPTRLLEAPPSLRSLTLGGIEEVVIDHESGDQDTGTWRSTKLERLVVIKTGHVLSIVDAAADDSLSAFFDHLKYLDMTFNMRDLFGDRQWNVILSRWTRLETLAIRWDILGLYHLIEPGEDFLALCQAIPWASFQGLRSLSCYVSSQLHPTHRLFNAETDPSRLLFAGPSWLPQLQDLHVTYDVEAVLVFVDSLYEFLDAIYLYDLNRTIEDPNAFPALKTLRTMVKYKAGLGGALVTGSDEAVQLVVDRLPAVFGKGGRREIRGWVTLTEFVQTRVYGMQKDLL